MNPPPLSAVRDSSFAIGLIFLAASAQSLAAGSPALDEAVKAWAETPTAPRYAHAWVDLNNDAETDAVVLLSDSAYRGSGGCRMLILKGTNNGFHLLSSSTVIRKPILLSPELRHGWHTLLVSVGGGGMEPGQAVLVFDGTQCPANPTMQPQATEADLKTSRSLKFEQ